MADTFKSDEEYIFKTDFIEDYGLQFMPTGESIVRCKNCKNYEEARNGCNGFCKEWDTSTYTWDYCSRGERKEVKEE